MKRKQLINILLLITGITVIAFSCKDTVVVDEGYEAPAPPAEVNSRNVMTIEFYSRLNDETLFLKDETEMVVNHINSITTPLAYLFDRSDAHIGQTSPAVEIGWKTKTKSFFVQNTLSENYIQGTGMIVKPIINVFEGTAIPDTLFIGGCTLMAPLGYPVVITLMTCRLDSKIQIPAMVKILGDGLKTNKIIIGTVKQNMGDYMKNHLKYNMKDFRLSFHATDVADKTRQIFVLSPINFVTREVTPTNVGYLPMYQCKIEYLN